MSIKTYFGPFGTPRGRTADVSTKHPEGPGLCYVAVM